MATRADVLMLETWATERGARLSHAAIAAAVRLSRDVRRVVRNDIAVPCGGMIVVVNYDWSVEDMLLLDKEMPQPWGWADIGDFDRY